MEELNFLETVKEQADQKKKIKKQELSKETPGVNLMSSDARKEVSRHATQATIKTLFGSVIAAICFTLVLYAGVKVYGYLASQNAHQLSLNLGKIDQDIAAIEGHATELNQFQNKLSSINALSENHPYWSLFLEQLEKNTLPSVSYEALSVAQGSPLSLSASAPNFKTIGQQLLTMQKATDLIGEVRIGSGNAVLDQSGEVSAVNFEISFIMNPHVLKKK